MPPRRRQVLGHLLFFGILALIIVSNRSSPTNSTFAWTQVRHRTTAAAVPSLGPACPGLAESTKPALVVARVRREDAAWLKPLRARYNLCVYTADAAADDSRTLPLPANRGHEAMAYLTFLIDNYASLPAAGAVFVHGSRRAWHNDDPSYDNAVLLAALNVSAALAPTGYHNLRCDWAAGTCATPSAAPQGSLETRMRAALEPFNQRVVSDAALPRALATMFGGDASAKRIGGASSDSGRLRLGRADAVRAQCCAQFVVARANMVRHARQEYVALRQWLLDGTAPSDDEVAGRILSYVWHILFLPTSGSEVHLPTLNAMACPSAAECYCRLYARCHLVGCTEAWCPEQYRVPPGYQVPDL